MMSMKKVNQKDVRGTSPEGTKGVDFKQLIAKDLKAPNFYMRLFEISPGGHTPKHSHEWEHEVYVVEGSGKIVLKDREEELVAGDAVLVEPNDLHQFVNSSKSPLRLICVIPKPPGD
jgi:quercetin dioxygenase-like cupin family protein